MNDQILGEFQQRIDRALHPLIAAPGRLKTMREELLSHLVETYNEELSRTETDQFARDAALRRFGSTTEVTTRLQSTIPPIERALFSFLSGKETLMTRILWIIAIVLIVIGKNIFSPIIGEQIFFAGMALAAILAARHLFQKENLASRYLGRGWAYYVGAFGFFFGPAIVLPALAKLKQNAFAGSANTAQQYIPTLCIEALALGLLITILGLTFLTRALLLRPRVQT